MFNILTYFGLNETGTTGILTIHSTESAFADKKREITKCDDDK